MSLDIAVLFALAAACAAAGVGFARACFERRSLADWLFVVGMATLAIESVLGEVAADAILLTQKIHWESWALVAMSFLPGTWLLFSLTYARGNYQEFIARWRFVLAAAFIVPIGLALTFRTGLMAESRQPSGLPSTVLRLGTPGVVLQILFLVTLVLVLMNLERTYRSTVGTMRWRVKFMILGLGVLFAVRAYSSSQALLFGAANFSLQAVNSAGLLVACILIMWSIVRAGHFEVKVYPSHSVLQNSLTISLAAIYLVIVGALSKVITVFGGVDAFELKAFLVLVALVLLTALLLSERVRMHTRRFISRHFQRPLHDYRTIWRTFNEATARCVEPQALGRAVAALVSDIFQALSVTIWLVDERKTKLTLAGSTSLSNTQAQEVVLGADEVNTIMRALSNRPEAVDIDSHKEAWTDALRRLHPGEFRTGGKRACVPLTAGKDILGLIILGDRVNGIPYSTQDFELLKSLADQAAANFLSIQLSEKLTRGRQLAAFQAMSAFFVHDLKNTASTLSLMLKNLPVHYEDPDFRADALRGISKTVTHLNDIISRLNMFRQELQVRPVECDLNQLVCDTLNRQAPNPGVKLVKDFAPLPKVLLDPAQIQRVITNLVLNAVEALGAGGQIQIKTGRRNGWAELAVADNGCGMTPEFVQAHLFHPFETTKKSGIGIGMFQCKTIVEAHRGRIEVESAPGKGTAFHVLLPLSS